MNILIVGNGFDLSHYLPTKYDHFMDVMGAIEEKDTGGLPKNLVEKSIDEWLNLLEKTFQKRDGIASPPHDMTFDELFYKTRDSKFIEKTKEFYLTESVEICAKDVLRLQYRLGLNCWYQYFKNHVEEIKTWIDFEQKIEEVLVAVARCIVDLESMDHPNKIRNYINMRGKDDLKIKIKDLETLKFFNFTTKNEGAMIPSNLNMNFCHGKNVKNGFCSTEFMTFLHTELERFIEIFNLYLEIIVGQLFQSGRIDIDAEWSYPDKIFSFNYTNTYQRLHDSVDVEYLHGSCGEYQNIVLGVSDLEDDSLKKIKAYGFTKYQQKLFKDTDYLFLDEFKKLIEDGKKQFDTDLKLMSANALSDIRTRFIKRGLGSNATTLDLNFIIWGHSLDVSDKDYILDLFNLNDDIDRNVRVTVYYFDKTAKFSLLNNLLAILGKDKVEQWMKNKWLCFKPNPEIKFLVQ
ncbi:hypothetical protein HNP31_000618 [Acinetobacter johnsonii]|uniref:AbiH family protein n=1 Tax=Acinetobacter johnsonii TaxID=40214 RepID=UPI0016229B36|nr:AbiH family protein [Acinetobacter johnsonii]MBB4808932.1 hypothetical protein [Acinetobacter johnsonii]